MRSATAGGGIVGKIEGVRSNASMIRSSPILEKISFLGFTQKGRERKKPLKEVQVWTAGRGKNSSTHQGRIWSNCLRYYRNLLAPVVALA
jgi:hypothetical protein